MAEAAEHGLPGPRVCRLHPQMIQECGEDFWEEYYDEGVHLDPLFLQWMETECGGS